MRKWLKCGEQCLPRLSSFHTCGRRRASESGICTGVTRPEIPPSATSRPRSWRSSGGGGGIIIADSAAWKGVSPLDSDFRTDSARLLSTFHMALSRTALGSTNTTETTTQQRVKM